MDTLRAMKALVRSVELGSLSAAARSLGTTQPTVSKLLAGLERQAGAKLLERSSVRVQTTTEGERFLETARRVVEDYEQALVELQGLRAEPMGLVRLAAPVALGQCWLNPRLPDFLELHPGIELEVMLEDRFVDLVEERIDVAVRIGGELPPHLVARTLAQWPRYLVASPAYLKRHARPRQPAELAGHDCLRYAGSAPDAVTLSGAEGSITVPTRCRYRINSAVALLHGAEQGLLERVLPDWVSPAQVGHVLYQPRRRQPARVAALLDFLFSVLRVGA
ncbi:LysR substrate-binding domain-containing protein [Rubrivivax sp. RP6-9]|uniref:LysR family transcriptional regulator n=1 Tax=Rubrivivax sp. RP6-9 TaxID=3415750 RepID=UPI003CC54DC6